MCLDPVPRSLALIDHISENSCIDFAISWLLHLSADVFQQVPQEVHARAQVRNISRRIVEGRVNLLELYNALRELSSEADEAGSRSCKTDRIGHISGQYFSGYQDDCAKTHQEEEMAKCQQYIRAPPF
jgi:hypothetical protein